MRNICGLLMTGTLALSLACGAGLAFAAGMTPDATIDKSALELNDAASAQGEKLAAQKKSKSAESVVQELIDEFLEKKGYELGYNASKDKSFEMGIATVGVNSASPDFGKFRAVAFDQAYNDALKAFIKSQANKVSTEAIASFFADNSTNAAEFAEELSSGKSKFGALVDKIVALGDAITSDKLREHGIDPDQYNAAPPDQKKKLLEQNLRKVIRETAFKTLGGVVPVQTFIGRDGNGNESVGVVIVYSPKFEAVATALRHRQKPAMSAQGLPLKNQLPLNDPAQLYNILGIRVLFDENGVVLVSYGQWSSSYKGTNAQRAALLRKAAMEQAESTANAQIAEFLSTTFSAESSSETGSIMEQSAVKKGRTGETIEENLNSIIDIRKEVASRKANETLRGASTLKRWEYETPEGHTIVGVVKTYSFAGIEAATRPAPATTAGTNAPATPHKGSGQASGETGMDLMDIDAF